MVQKPIKKEVKPEPKPTPKPIIEQPQVATPQPMPPQTVVAPPQAPVKSNAPAPIQTLSFSKDNHPILQAIKKAIDSNMQYPRKARRMGMEGMVLIEFLLHHSGHLADIKLLASSGHMVLDESAIETIKRASSAFPRPGTNIRIQIPISYSLLK